jgi:hypothetical protein
MAVTLVSTIGGENSNSYVDVAFADDYFNNHYSLTKRVNWATLSSAQKPYLLVMACRIVDSAAFTVPIDIARYTLSSSPSDPTRFVYITSDQEPVKYQSFQALQFPTNQSLLEDGTLYVPEEIKFAQCEQAVYMIGLDESALEQQAQGILIDQLGLGSGKVSLYRKYNGNGQAFAPMAIQFMNPWLLKQSQKVRRA